MVSSSKRTHTKSRLGCGQCKKKRIKCDERPPSCGPCTKRSLVCDYAEWSLSSQKVLKDAKLDVVSKPIFSVPEEAPCTQTTRLDVEQLMLMHHYTLKTSLTVCRVLNRGVQQIWQTKMPLLAQKYPFLMHGMLAISALHAASEGEFDEGNALRYYNDALYSFRTSYRVVRPEDSEAILGFCILIFLISIGINSKSEVTLSDPIKGFLAPLEVLRMTMRFFRSFRSQIDETTLKEIVPERNPVTSPLCEGTAAALRNLEKCNRAMVTSEAERKICQEAINQLSYYFSIVSPRPRDWNFLIRWLILIPESFHVLLQQNNPMALIVLAHWCVPIHHAPRRWFMNDWPERMIRSIANRLGSVWDISMQWPLGEINATGSAICRTGPHVTELADLDQGGESCQAW
ncbi:hypothetical protein EV356DRAFT_8653 [Viridothelium virens]|uniref:Zn(2)-C6 fungal-type domain-containing protein n=1 Tax=Viridothelium virens TaxID=1048519 RepID=A0A6A6HQ95_VIRVR|nr:hypothetical protein EV356DRAFT_8653 [Viridothelium virens]